MVKIPDNLECLFSASVEERGDSYSIEIPRDELEAGSVTAGETYRVVVLEGSPAGSGSEGRQHSESGLSSTSGQSTERTPPVETGDIREVTIETIGDQGDGIAKIDRGYVVIVPGTRPDDEVTVEIQRAQENVAFAEVHETDSTITDEDPTKPEDVLSDEALDEGE